MYRNLVSAFAATPELYAYEAPDPPPFATTPLALPTQEFPPLLERLVAGSKVAVPEVPPVPTEKLRFIPLVTE